MATPFSRALLIAITLLLGVMSSGTWAQTTNYDFSVNAAPLDGVTGWSNPYFDGGSQTLFTGVVQVDSKTGTVLGYSNFQINDGTYGGGYLTTFIPLGSTNFLNSTSDYNFNIGFYGPTGISGQAFIQPSTPSISGGGLMFGGASYSDLFGPPPDYTPIVSGPFASAPEIDGSLAPKVGFLLGCLFLMFGCKKQVLESMMIA